MTDVASALPSAGWYDDPSSDGAMRWWDGRGWTDNSMPKPASIPEPSAPPMGIAYSVDEQRAAESPRRSARARSLRSEDGLAPIVQLHPAHVDVDPQLTPFSHSAEPLPGVPPVTAPQDAYPIAEQVDLTHLPQLGRVPDAVFAPEPVAVVAAPLHVEPAPVDAPVAAWTPLIEDDEPIAVPAPGSLVGAPELGTTIDFVLPGGAAVAPLSPVATPAPVAPMMPVAPPMSAAPTLDTGLPMGLPASPEAFAEPAPEPVVQEATPAAPRQSTDWWAGLIPSRSSSGSARLLALSPFFTLGALAAAAFVVVKVPELLLGLLALPILAVVIPIVLASIDRRALHELGWERQASALWALLGPFWYIVARQVVLSRQGAKVAPLIIGTIVISILAPIALTVATEFFPQQLQTLMTHIAALAL